MKLRKNDVLLLSDFNSLTNGKYRVIYVFEKISTLLLFPLEEKRLIVKPLPLSIKSLMQGYKEGKVTPSQYPLPIDLTKNIDEIPEVYRQKMDRNFNCIKELVSDEVFLFDYATKQRVRTLSLHADKVGRDRKELSRLLTSYWRYGLLKIALLPRYALSGGRGVEKKFINKANGAPISTRTLAVQRRKKYVIKDEDKEIFRKVISSKYLKDTKPKITDVYQEMLDEHYAHEKMHARLENRPPYLPSYKQFCYFLKNNFSKDEIEQKRTTESDYLKNKRGMLGVATQRSSLPGSAFEIDATVADVHIVSEFGPQYLLGRPTIYIIIDRASRMIVGLHVSLYHASWRAARQALVNCFLPKAEFCKLYGIEINDSEWPCSESPIELVCDNGEMIGLEPTSKVTPLTQLSFTPPYRPDAKGVVEKRFDILNDKQLHKLIGTTRGGKVVRGDPDPRKEALMTLSEVTRIIILEVLEHNKSVFKELAYASSLIIENNLAPTPLNYWKIHVAKFRSELTSCDPNDVIAQLLPSDTVSMTEFAIEYKGLYYSCPEIEQRKLPSIARASGQWQLEARIDENTTNYIYVRLDKNKGFTKCELTVRRRLFRDRPMIEADFVEDWLESQKDHLSANDSRNEVRHEVGKITKLAAKRNKDAKQTSFNEKKKGIRKNRQNEIYATTNIIAPATPNPASSLTVAHKEKSDSPVIPLPQGPKRTPKDGLNED